MTITLTAASFKEKQTATVNLFNMSFFNSPDVNKTHKWVCEQCRLCKSCGRTGMHGNSQACLHLLQFPFYIRFISLKDLWIHLVMYLLKKTIDSSISWLKRCAIDMVGFLLVTSVFVTVRNKAVAPSCKRLQNKGDCCYWLNEKDKQSRESYFLFFWEFFFFQFFTQTF